MEGPSGPPVTDLLPQKCPRCVWDPGGPTSPTLKLPSKTLSTARGKRRGRTGEQKGAN